MRSKIPVSKSRVVEKTVDVLRDTGCSGFVVKKGLVSEDLYTGDFNCMLLIDNTVRKVPVAKITVDIPYLSRQVEAQCHSDTIYDLIIGTGQVQVKLPSTSESTVVDRDRLKQLQTEGDNLKKYWYRNATLV